jgi:hypothetical protein
LNRNFGLLGFVAVLFSGCGGGGDASTPAPTSASPEGVYSGNLTGARSPNFSLLVLENNEIWALSGESSANLFFVRGLLRGQGSVSGNNLSVAGAREYSETPAATYSIAATFQQGVSINGSISNNLGTIGFSGNLIDSAFYNYNLPANLSQIAGLWNATSLTGRPVSINIAGSGGFTASSDGCSFSGTLTPRSSNKNVFNMSLRFGPAPCALPNQDATGIGLTYPTSSGRRQLIIAGTDLSRNNGTVLFASK